MIYEKTRLKKSRASVPLTQDKVSFGLHSIRIFVKKLNIVSLDDFDIALCTRYLYVKIVVHTSNVIIVMF